MSVLNTIQQRRSVRRFRPDRLPPELLEMLLTAGVWAPSAHNRQPWRFAVVQDQARQQHLASAMGAQLRADLEADGVSEAIIAADTARSYERLTAAPALIVVCLSMLDMDQYPDQHRAHNEYLMAVQSTAMAGQNILLAAHDLGLGACWMCAPLFVPYIVRAALDLPEDWQPQGVIALGYPAQERQKTRNPLEKSVLWR
jgi:coenzyme F420-0:L-glutamate ligase / coenzyme F420-1:gamma-L-glutamate ligase